MPIDLSIYDRINTQFGPQLGQALDPVYHAEKRNALADLMNQRKLRDIQVKMQQSGLERQPVIQQHEDAQYQVQQQDLLRKQAEEQRRREILSQLTPEQQQIYALGGGSKLAESMMPERLSSADRLAREKFDFDRRQAGKEKPSDRIAREKFEWEKKGGKVAAKPMPATALKMQNEALDAIGAASSLNADLGAFADMVEQGKLKLGLTANMLGATRNYMGASTPESRNLASFKANLERLRNESLRLNKGVQTEGDAVRAWNEILANINDPELVKQRLREVQKVNERAAQLKQMEVDIIRGNYGRDPMDVSGRTNVPSAYSGTQSRYDADKESRYQAWKAQQGR